MLARSHFRVVSAIRGWRGRTRGATLAVGIVAILLSAGLASAAIPDSQTGIINGCYLENAGHLRVIDAEEGETCRPGELAVFWNQTGPQGAQGPQGLQGEQGLAGADGAQGLEGPQGSAGADGADGAPGDPGADGADGQNGDDGVSVTSEALDPGEDSNCPHGGSKFTSSSGVTYACNGSDGEDFAGSFTSPNGLFSVTVNDTGATLQGPGGTVRVTAAGASVVGTLVTLNGGGCGVLRPTDFFTYSVSGQATGTFSQLIGLGSPTVRFGC